MLLGDIIFFQKSCQCQREVVRNIFYFKKNGHIFGENGKNFFKSRYFFSGKFLTHSFADIEFFHLCKGHFPYRSLICSGRKTFKMRVVDTHKNVIFGTVNIEFDVFDSIFPGTFERRDGVFWSNRRIASVCNNCKIIRCSAANKREYNSGHQ